MSVMKLEVVDLVKDYPGTRAIDGVSFTVKSGRVHGFLGPNGAGKTTTMKIIVGLLKPTSGHVRLTENGNDLPEFQRKGVIGYLPENPPLYSDLTVANQLSFVAQIQGVPSSAIKERCRYALERTDLVSYQGRLIGNLSKGLKQRVGMAQAIVFGPKILILDEPTSGLDPASIQDMRELIDELKADHTILLSSHVLHEVELICSDVTIINQGKVRATGELKALMKSYGQGTRVRVQVLGWGMDSKKKLEKYSFVAGIEEKPSPEGHELLVNLKGQGDLRPELAQALLSTGAQLLTFTREERPLEDIFLKLVQENQGEAKRL